MSAADRPLRERVRKHYDYLISELMVSCYVNILFQEKVLSSDEKERIVSAPGGRQERARDFVDTLMHKSESSIQIFFDIVREHEDKQPHIYYVVFPEHKPNEMQAQRSVVAEATETLETQGDVQWEQLLLPHFAEVVEALRPSILLDNLRASRLLTREEYEELHDGRLLEVDRSRKLLNSILPLKGKGSFDMFCQVLSKVDGQQHIVTQILKIETKLSSSQESPANVSTIVQPTNSINQENGEGTLSSRLSSSDTALFRDTRKLEQSKDMTLCIAGKQEKQSIATFFCKPEHLKWIMKMKSTISKMCGECFGIKQDEVMVTCTETTEMKTMLEVWDASPTRDHNEHSVYLDVDSLLAVILVHGIEPHEIDDSRRKHLERFLWEYVKTSDPHIAFSSKCKVLEIITFKSSFIVLRLSIDLYVSLLCTLGYRDLQVSLTKSLKDILPGATKIVFQLGGLPPLELTSVNVKNQGSRDQDLHFACEHGNADAVRNLLSCGATTVNTIDSYGNQPLHLACSQGSSEKVELLLLHGADPNAVNKAGRTPLHEGLQWRGSPAVIKVLLKHHAKVDVIDNNGNQPLHLACKQGSIEIVELLLLHGADPNAVNKAGRTPLQEGFQYHDFSAVIKVLLKHHAKVDVIDNKGNQPLHLACKQGSSEIVELLLLHGADANAVNKAGRTPLHEGFQWCGSRAVIKVLLKHHAKVDVIDNDGNQPLHLACNQGSSEIVELLLLHGADPNAVNKAGRTPLHEGFQWHDFSAVIKVLLKHHAKVDVIDNNGNQPLHLACNQGSSEIVELLLLHGADPNAVNKAGRTPLHEVACQVYGSAEVAKMLLKRHAKVDVIDNDGNQPLHLAYRQSNIEIREVLLLHGADANVLQKQISSEPTEPFQSTSSGMKPKASSTTQSESPSRH